MRERNGETEREALAAELRALRESTGRGVLAWAELLGVSRVTVWRWEHGKDRPTEPALRLARRLAEDLSTKGRKNESV